jgi:phosphoglycolate phosphatase
MLIRRALGPEVAESDVQAGLQLFLSYYRDHMLDESVLYPGVPEALERLSDFRLAVLTNKPIRFSRMMLEGLGILDRFKAVYGGNSFERKKPDPIGIHQILKDTGGSAGATWMIGDSAVDVLTGRNAGVKTCGVSWGYAFPTFEHTPPDVVIDRFADLEGVVRLKT